MEPDVIELGEMTKEYIDETKLIKARYEAACYIVDDLKRYKEWYIVEDKTDLLALWLFASDGSWADYAEHFKVSFPAKVQVYFYWPDGDDIPTAQLKVLNPSKLNSFKLKLGLLQKRLQGQSVSWESYNVR